MMYSQQLEVQEDLRFVRFCPAVHQSNRKMRLSQSQSAAPPPGPEAPPPGLQRGGAGEGQGQGEDEVTCEHERVRCSVRG